MELWLLEMYEAGVSMEVNMPVYTTYYEVYTADAKARKQAELLKQLNEQREERLRRAEDMLDKLDTIYAAAHAKDTVFQTVLMITPEDISSELYKAIHRSNIWSSYSEKEIWLHERSKALRRLEEEIAANSTPITWDSKDNPYRFVATRMLV